MFKRFKLLVSILVVGLVVTSFTVTSGASAHYNGKANKHVTYKEHINTKTYNWIVSCFDSIGLTWKDEERKDTPESEEVDKGNDHENKQTEEHEWQQETPSEGTEQNEQVDKEGPEQNEQVDKEETVEESKTEEKNDTLHVFENEVVQLTNKERQAQGLVPLQIDEALSSVAREKSRDIQVNKYFDHQSPVYGSPFDMIQSYGITYRTAGENIAMGQRSPEEVVNAWMNSPGHRANILNPNYTHIGVGYVAEGNYWTQQFIGK